RDNLGHISFNTRWIPGQTSSVRFWLDNWLGYTLADRLGIPVGWQDTFTDTIGDYYYEDTWHFTEDFITRHTDIVIDILSYPMSQDTRDLCIWTGVPSGKLTAKTAYSYCRHRFPSVRWGRWIWSGHMEVRRSLLTWRVVNNLWPFLPVFVALAAFVVPIPKEVNYIEPRNGVIITSPENKGGSTLLQIKRSEQPTYRYVGI
ncbi:RNA-directed DNA polymerase (reversetranscriptase)-related family protein, partial [Striga asiatica]